jgi:hypothetical protein
MQPATAVLRWCFFGTSGKQMPARTGDGPDDLRGHHHGNGC